MLYSHLLLPTITSHQHILTLINNLFLSNVFNTVTLMYENNTKHILNDIKFHHVITSNKLWLTINIDEIMLNPSINFTIEQNFKGFLLLTFLSVLMINKFSYMYDARYLNIFQNSAHLIFVTNDHIDSYELLLLAHNHTSIALLKNWNSPNIYQFAMFDSIQGQHVEIQVNNKISEMNSTTIYDKIFYEKPVKLYNLTIIVTGNINPPRIINLLNRVKQLRSIGGYDGFLYSLIGYYFNATIEYNAIRAGGRKGIRSEFENKINAQHITFINAKTVFKQW